MEISTIKALTFDVYGTVVAHRATTVRECQQLGRAKGLDVDWEKLVDAWRSRHEEKLNRERRGEAPWTKAAVLYRESLVEVLGKFGIGGLSDAEVDRLNGAWGRSDPWPDSVEGLSRLKRKFVIAALSNGNVALMISVARHAGLPWDMILGAEIARRYKPHPEVYLKAADCLGARPEECLMVAAHNYDLLAAQKCGFRSAFIDRGAVAHGPGDKHDLAPGGRFDLIAKDLVDLAGQLGC